MKYKYGDIPEKQFHEYKKILHKKIHWLLIYEESSYVGLSDYIISLQFYLSGLLELINSPELINLINIVECIKMEYENPSHAHKQYRKLVLDAHSIIDSIPEKDGDINE